MMIKRNFAEMETVFKLRECLSNVSCCDFFFEKFNSSIFKIPSCQLEIQSFTSNIIIFPHQSAKLLLPRKYRFTKIYLSHPAKSNNSYSLKIIFIIASPLHRRSLPFLPPKEKTLTEFNPHPPVSNLPQGQRVE